MNYNWYFKGLDRALLELSGARTMSHQNPKVFQEILQLKHRYPDSYFEPILIVTHFYYNKEGCDEDHISI